MSDPTPIEALADSLTGGDPVNDLAITLMRAWGRADPKSSVAQHPASYVATFADLARAVQPAPESDEREALDRLREHVEWYGNDDTADDSLVSVPIGHLRTVLARRSQPAPRTVSAARVPLPCLDHNRLRCEPCGWVTVEARSQPAPRTVSAEEVDAARDAADTSMAMDEQEWCVLFLRALDITVEEPRG